MLLKKQRNTLFEILQRKDLNASGIREKREEESYELSLLHDDDEYYFYVEVEETVSNPSAYGMKMRPGVESVISEYTLNEFEDVLHFFRIWTDKLKEEIDAPDLWAEAAKTAQLFAPSATLGDDKFTRTELAEVQGQLRQLQQSFTTAALPEAARQKLIELTQTAAVKAEGLTKKDWQNWIIGGFISGITALSLNPTQAAEVLKLVKAAFGGLFLH